jgi:hypothetical protein
MSDLRKLTKIELGCWNCGGVYGSFIYVKALLRSLDILALIEHWLCEDELTFLDSPDSITSMLFRVAARITI